MVFCLIQDYLQMDLACSVAFVLNFDRMDCSVLENNWALTFSFYPSSSTSTLSCSRRRNPPPAWTPLRRRKSLASKFWSTYFDNFNNCPAVQDTKFYLGIGIPKKRFRLCDASERFPYDLRSFDLLRCRFVFSFLFFLFISFDISELYSLFHSNTLSIFSAWSFVYDAQQNWENNHRKKIVYECVLRKRRSDRSCRQNIIMQRLAVVVQCYSECTCVCVCVWVCLFECAGVRVLRGRGDALNTGTTTHRKSHVYQVSVVSSCCTDSNSM